ncbi:hypothetical protein ACOSP7_023287 [Xanthoceras sorbifolium]
MTKPQRPHRDKSLAGYFTCYQNPTQPKPPSYITHLTSLFHSLSLTRTPEKKTDIMKRGLDSFVAMKRIHLQNFSPKRWFCFFTFSTLLGSFPGDKGTHY